MKFLGKFINNEAKFQRIFGLNFKQLDLLVQKIESLWIEAEAERLGRPDRKRSIGGGRPYKLAMLVEKICTVLLYYKQYPTQELLGLMVGVNQSVISRLLNKMLPLIEQAADPLLKTYLAQAKKDYETQRINNLHDFLAKHPDLKDVSTDATEQQCYRATNYEKQKEYYSGKSKQHTIKTQISASITGRILDVSESFPGSVHDKTVIDQEKTIEKFDKKVPHRFDAGYQGVQKDHPDYYLITPVKKPKKKELTQLDKEYNKYNSKRRVVAEHAFARLKKFRICGGLFRQPLELYNKTFRNIASILNFKLQNPVFAI